MKNAFIYLRNMLQYGGLTKEQYDSITRDINIQNIKAQHVYTAFTIIIFTYFTILRYTIDKRITAAVLLYFIIALLSLVVHVLDIRFQNNTSPINILLQRFTPYFMIMVSLGYGCYIMWLFPDRSLSAYVGIVGIIPILFCGRPIYTNALILIFSVTCEYILFTHHTNDYITDEANNLLVIMLLSMLCSTSVNSIRLKLFSIRHDLKMSAELDALTGCYNRFKFISNIEGNKFKDELPSVVYVDINGLHEVNNKDGHNAGDRMLKTVVKCISNHFGIKNVYRVGGDEIIVLCPDKNEEQITVCLASIDVYLAENDYHIAHGLCYRDETDNIKQAVDIAEKRMYEDKRIYYEKNHLDRRTNRS